MVDFPHPDSPTNAVNFESITIFRSMRMFFFLSLGYANVTFSNLNTPLKFSILIPLGGFLISD